MNYYNYFTEIEEHFVRRRGKHLYVSPLDWSLIAAWRDAGIPLHVAIRGIDIAMDGWESRKRRRSNRLSTLLYCHDAVMAEYERFLESRVGETPAQEEPHPGAAPPAKAASEEAGPDREALRRFFTDRIAEIKRLEAKQFSRLETAEGLSRVLARLEEVREDLLSGRAAALDVLERDLGILDELMIERLRPNVSPEQAAEWEQDAKKQLKVYRKRLPKETYRKILDDYLKGRIRRLFDVGELSLFSAVN